MIKNYFKIALRNLFKNKVLSFINISGLSIGIASCVLIWMYVNDELSFDQHHEKGDRIFRVTQSMIINGKLEKNAALEFPVGPLLRQLPEVTQMARLVNFSRYIIGQNPTVTYDDKTFYEERFFFADSTIFDVFTLPFVKGNPRHALDEPNTVVLTCEMAKKYFGTEDPLGKVIRFNNSVDLKVAGVLGPPSGPSHLQFDFLASMSSVRYCGLPRPNFNFESNWITNWFWTYVVIKDLALAPDLENKFAAFTKNNYAALHIQNQIKLYLQPVTDIHLSPEYEVDVSPAGNRLYAYTFSFIAGFVLLIACINFMNLSTARYTNRIKEIGLRKVIGADRTSLAMQFQGESVLMSVIAGIVALLIIELLMPAFNAFTEKQLSFHLSFENKIFLSFITITLVTGLLAGSYPAFFFSRFKPIEAFRNSASGGTKGGRLRKILVVLQFGISVILIVGTIVVRQQLSFMRSKQLGFEREHIVMLPIRGTTVVKKFQEFKTELLNHEAITGVTGVNARLGKEVRYTSFNIEGFQGVQILNVCRIEHDFVKTFGLQIVEGRDFSKDILTDNDQAFLINEAAMRQFGWTSAVGKAMKAATFDNAKPSKVIGVVKDFNFESLHHPVGPLVMLIGGYGFAAVKIRPHEIKNAIALIEATWKSFEPDKPFSFFFLSDAMNTIYATENKIETLSGYFSALAILIACLGLLGLAAFSSERRTKEIGIRKVLGASVAGMVGLLSREFVLLVLVANAAAWPVVYYLMQHWLENFAFRIDIGILPFIFAGFSSAVIAIATVGYQAIKAASANPVDALKYE